MSINPEELNENATAIAELADAFRSFEAACTILDETEKTLETSAEIHELEEKAVDYKERVQPEWGLQADMPLIYARNPVLAMGSLGISLANGYNYLRARRTKRKAETLRQRLYEE